MNGGIDMKGGIDFAIAASTLLLLLLTALFMKLGPGLGLYSY